MRVDPAGLAGAAGALRELGTALAMASGELNGALHVDSALLHAVPELGNAVAAPDLALMSLADNALQLAQSLEALQTAVRSLEAPRVSSRAF